jgi:hypothetical protein
VPVPVPVVSVVAVVAVVARASAVAWMRCPIAVKSSAANAAQRLPMPCSSARSRTRRSANASRRACSAGCGASAVSARRSAADSCPLVWPAARGSTRFSTARMVASSRVPVASRSLTAL